MFLGYRILKINFVFSSFPLSTPRDLPRHNSFYLFLPTKMERRIRQILESYFQSTNMNESKIQSFNRWFSDCWPSVIKSHFPLVVKFTHDYHIFDVEAITTNKPSETETDGTSHVVHPKETRLRQLTYAAQMYFHIRHRIFQMPNDDLVPQEIAIAKGKLIHDTFTPYVKTIKYPAMLRTVACHLSDGKMNYGECNSDIGGYFIIDGQEKMLMYRERPAYDKLFLNPIKDTSTSHIAEFRSSYYDQFKSTQTLKLGLSRITKTESPSLQILGVQGTQPIPWVTFVRALGVTRAKDIYTIFRFIARDRWNKRYEKLFKDSLKNNQGIITRQAALARIGGLVPQGSAAALLLPSVAAASSSSSSKGGKASSDAKEAQRLLVLEELGLNFIRNKFLPNMGNTEADDINKVFALCDFGCRLFDYAQDSSLRTNKDSYLNKRSESCEELLGDKSRQLLVSYLTTVKMNVLKKLKDNKTLDIHEIFGEDKVGKGIKEILASGIWHVTKGKVTQTGVSGKFDRANFIATQAQHMKVINQLRKEVKQIAPRLLPSTSYGTVCPSDSPEGHSCGLVKFNSILQHQSIGTNGRAIIDLLFRKLGVVDLRKIDMKLMEQVVEEMEMRTRKSRFVLVNVNGCPIGIHDDPTVVAQFVRDCRRQLSISCDTGVSYNHLSVDIRTDRGRNMRPLFVAENLWKLYGMWGIKPPISTEAKTTTTDEEGKEGKRGKATGNEFSLRGARGGVGGGVSRGGVKGGVRGTVGSPGGYGGRAERMPPTWEDLLAEGIIEYVDKEEEQNLLFATDLDNFLNGPGAWRIHKDKDKEEEISNGLLSTKRKTGGKQGMMCPLLYTHIEIHGSVFYGVSASLIPFPDHNQSPRNTYQCAMIRQAQGIPSSNAKRQRMDQSFMEMWYAQRPLVETQIHRILNCQNFPYGQNVMVAVCSMGEYNQEDASVSLKSAIDFGMLRSSIYRTTTISEKRQGKADNSEEFRKVDECKLAGRKKANYSHIEEDGLPAVGSPVEPGTVLAQKAIKQKESQVSKEYPLEWKDMSVTSGADASGRIDRVVITSTACGIRTAKIRVIKVATTREGDKFATRYGQKGINGESKNLVDMMYTEDGLVPHFVINCLAFASRMTWGEWLETLLATVAIRNGKFGDATAFSRQYRDALRSDLEEEYAHLRDAENPNYVKADAHIADEICEALAKLNLDCNGEHVMYSGSTGEKLRGRIFMGLTYVQKLKHMVADKICARGRGKVQSLTRQPTEPKALSRGGKMLRHGDTILRSSSGLQPMFKTGCAYSSDLFSSHL